MNFDTIAGSIQDSKQEGGWSSSNASSLQGIFWVERKLCLSIEYQHHFPETNASLPQGIFQVEKKVCSPVQYQHHLLETSTSSLPGIL